MLNLPVLLESFLKEIANVKTISSWNIQENGGEMKVELNFSPIQKMKPKHKSPSTKRRQQKRLELFQQKKASEYSRTLDADGTQATSSTAIPVLVDDGKNGRPESTGIAVPPPVHEPPPEICNESSNISSPPSEPLSPPISASTEAPWHLNSVETGPHLKPPDTDSPGVGNHSETLNFEDVSNDMPVTRKQFDMLRELLDNLG